MPAQAPALGMMVEVPAAALAIEAFDADFYSIGSNDLLQYLMAASRDEPELAALAAPGPAFWRVLRELASHGSLLPAAGSIRREKHSSTFGGVQGLCGRGRVAIRC